MTQQELLSLFNIATSVRPQDKFLLHTANGQAVEVTAELVRAYLVKGLIKITVDEQGYIYINDQKTDFKVDNISSGGEIPPDLIQRIEALEDANNPISLSVGISPSGLQKRGTTVATVTITFSLKKKDGTPVPITQATVNGTTTPVPDDSSSGSYQATAVTANTTYTVRVTAQGRTFQGSASITFVSPIYVGFHLADTATAIDFTALSEQSLRSSLGTLTPTLRDNDSPDNYLWICSPYRVSKVTSDGFGADITEAETLTHNGTTYYCYRSQSKQAPGKFNIVIS